MDESLTRSALLAAAKCIDTLHRARLVYTDLKAENLIFMEDLDSGNAAKDGNIVIKGVDLESAIPQRGHPLDYTPEASPPEFAVRYLQGEAYDFVLDYSYDIWSFGIIAYELAVGRGYFYKKQPAHIMKALGLGFQPPDVDNAIDDEKLCDLINKCLNLDPRKRPTAAQIINHPYFRGDGGAMPKLFGW
jgi:serine/threonine protein kinase